MQNVKERQNHRRCYRRSGLCRYLHASQPRQQGLEARVISWLRRRRHVFEPVSRCARYSSMQFYQFSEDLQNGMAKNMPLKAKSSLMPSMWWSDSRDGMTFNSRVLATHYSSEEERGRCNWTGEKICLICCHGYRLLSKPNYPNIDGVDFTNMRVAVIGTGSSAIQSTPSSPSRHSH